MKIIVALLLLFSLSACGEGLTDADLENLRLELVESQSLSSDLSVAIGELDAKRSSLQDEIKILESDLSNLPKVSELENRISEAQSAVDGEEELLAPLAEEVRLASLRLTELKKASNAYARYLRAQRTALSHQLCRETVEQAYTRQLGVANVSALDGLYTKPEIDSAVFMKDRLLFGIDPPVGCPGFWIDGDNPPNFASEARVRSSICPLGNTGLLSRDPARFKGDCVRVWGAVVQYDSNTGPCKFHANIGNSSTSRWNYVHRVEFKVIGDCTWLDDLDVGTNGEWWAVVQGPLTYTTTNGGSNTIPSLSLISWRKWS